MEKKSPDLPVEKRKAWSEHDVQAMFGTPVGTLRNWRSQGRGPKYYKIGSRVYYRPAETEQFYFSHPVLTKDARE